VLQVIVAGGDVFAIEYHPNLTALAKRHLP